MCRGRRGSIGAGIPVVILLAVNATVLGEAGELRLEGQLTFTALQAPQVPLFVHSQQVVPVRDLAAAAGAERGLLGAQRGHALQGKHKAPLRRTRGGDALLGTPSPKRELKAFGGAPAGAGATAQRHTSGKRSPLRLAPFLQRLPGPSVRILLGLLTSRRLGHLEPLLKNSRTARSRVWADAPKLECTR